ncbi:hypothetical protein [Streptomyces sp. NPDC055210]
MAMPNTFIDGFDPAHMVDLIDSDINMPPDLGMLIVDRDRPEAIGRVGKTDSVMSDSWWSCLQSHQDNVTAEHRDRVAVAAPAGAGERRLRRQGGLS